MLSIILECKRMIINCNKTLYFESFSTRARYGNGRNMQILLSSTIQYSPHMLTHHIYIEQCEQCSVHGAWYAEKHTHNARRSEPIE